MTDKPMFADGQEPFGSEYPTTDAYLKDGFFKIDEPGAIATPCQMVSIATTKTDLPKISRNQFSGVADLPDDNLNGKY